MVRKGNMMKDAELKLAQWFFSLIGYFNHHSFFTQELWRSVEGFKDKDGAEIKAAFMHYWFHNEFGYYTCPCGCSWFSELGEDSYNLYIETYKPVFEAYAKWCEKQR